VLLASSVFSLALPGWFGYDATQEDGDELRKRDYHGAEVPVYDSTEYNGVELQKREYTEDAQDNGEELQKLLDMPSWRVAYIITR
jgi:hypothetical protein